VFAAIDQAEELFADLAHQNRHGRPFIDELTEALDEHPDLHLLLSIWESSRIDLSPYEHDLGRTSQAWFRLLPLPHPGYPPNPAGASNVTTSHRCLPFYTVQAIVPHQRHRRCKTHAGGCKNKVLERRSPRTASLSQTSKGWSKSPIMGLGEEVKDGIV
jgi:hypothetical protein